MVRMSGAHKVEQTKSSIACVAYAVDTHIDVGVAVFRCKCQINMRATCSQILQTVRVLGVSKLKPGEYVLS